MSTRPDRRRRWCLGTKIKHAEAEAAERHCTAIEMHNARHGKTRPDRRLTVYWCNICSAFHVGSERADVPPASK